MTLHDAVNIKELAEYLGHHDPGFTLRLYRISCLPPTTKRGRLSIVEWRDSAFG